MKVQAKFLVEGELGRKCWITRVDGKLAFGTIYAQEKDAADLTESEIDYLVLNAGTKYIINEITPA